MSYSLIGRASAAEKLAAIRACRAAAAAVGCQDRGVADAEAGVHDLVLAAGRDRPRRVRAGHLLEAGHERHLGPERLAVEIERLFAAAFETDMGFDAHDVSSVF